MEGTRRAIRKNGLRLSGTADFTAKLNATSDASELPRCDYGIVATKAIHTKGAMAQVARAFDENSAVCSVQNGVGNEELIADHVKYVIRGTAFPAGHPIAVGDIGFDIKGDTWIGPFEPTKTPMSMVEELAGFITRSGLNVIPLKDARGAQWTKLIFNASTNPVGALTLLHHGAATRLPYTGELFNDLISEGESVAKALGIELHGDPSGSSTEGRECTGQAPRQHVARHISQASDRSRFHERRNREMGEKDRYSNAIEQSSLAADQGPRTFWSDPD
jgi:2-dehydropantoate 2-reductase